MLATIIEIALMVLMLVGIVKEEKLIAFEDKILDSIANSIAKVIVSRRRRITAEQRAQRAQQAAKKRRSQMRLVQPCTAYERNAALYIA